VPIYWNSFTYYENKVRVRVEKYFFDTLPTGQTVDVSTFIEGGLVMLIHLCSLRSFGVPYMSPLAPFIKNNVDDTITRMPIWAFKERPRLISQKNIIRSGKNQKPQPPKQHSDKSKSQIEYTY
ncbi:spore germination protein, partial [Bacillus sporothermodurans]